ncbi:MAG: GLPGLI family protein, partial [Chitinophagaceae bacterium]
ANNELFLKEAFDKYQKDNPQFKVLKSTLSFANNKTLLVPEPPVATTGMFNDLPMIAQNNIVYTDLAVDSQVSQKKVFEQTFLLKDNASNIRWKITDEVREIAGYSCRRANGLIMDSIYVVAFYSNEILVSGGPESFTGLPGMILQVTLPHENVTWVAKRVLDMDVPASGIVPPQNGNTVDRKGLYSFLNNAAKDWGDRREATLKSFLF